MLLKLGLLLSFLNDLIIIFKCSFLISNTIDTDITHGNKNSGTLGNCLMFK
jgi:hypothetical protein